MRHIPLSPILLAVYTRTLFPLCSSITAPSHPNGNIRRVNGRPCQKGFPLCYTGVRLRLDNELISFMITVSCVEKWCDAFEFSSSSRSISLVGRGSTAPPRIPCAARCESPYADRHPEKGAETHPKSAQYLTGFESDHIRESPDLSTSYEKHLPESRYVRFNPLSLWDLQPDTSVFANIPK